MWIRGFSHALREQKVYPPKAEDIYPYPGTQDIVATTNRMLTLSTPSSCNNFNCSLKYGTEKQAGDSWREHRAYMPKN